MRDYLEINGNFPLILVLLGSILLRPDRICEDIALLILFVNDLLLFFLAHKKHL